MFVAPAIAVPSFNHWYVSVPAPSVIFAVKVRPATSSAQSGFDGLTVIIGFLSSSTFMETTLVGEPPVSQ